MSFSQSIFKVYDIRGLYPEEINEGSAYQIGRAFAVYLKEFELPVPDKVVVGEDTRVSSPILARSFIDGITDEGINVWDIGMAAVDSVYFASGAHHLPAAMVTASHNPKEWNGFKLMKSDVNFFNVSDLEGIIKNLPPKISENIKGKISHENIRERYIKHVLSFIDTQNLKPMRIAVYTGSGAVGPILKSILAKLPIEYVIKKNIGDARDEIRAGHYHFGCSFDTDGDRVIFIDERGETVNPSIIGAIMAKRFLKQYRYGKVVYGATVGNIVPDVVSAYGGEPIRERVGHTYISKRLKEVGGIIGVESSGHYYLKNNFYADSGIVGFLLMLEILSGQKKSLSSLAAEFSKYFSIPEITFKVSGQEEFIKKIAQNFEGYHIDWLDGLTVTTPDFWLNIRPSNTEPLVRLNIEAKDEIILGRVKKDLVALIKKDLL